MFALAGRIAASTLSDPPAQEVTLKVGGRSTITTVDVVADATGLSSRAGSALLALIAQRLGLTDGLSGALAGTRERRSGHDPGRVLCDLAVMAADGGWCVSDIAVLAGQPVLFGEVASVLTARRVLLWIGEAELDRVRRGRAPSLVGGHGGMGRLPSV